LKQPPQFLRNPDTASGRAIRHENVKHINPNDKVFEAKTAMALKHVLEKEDPGVVELPRVVQDSQGKDVNEWQAVYQLSYGCVVFLEAKYRMSKVSC
jgi:hypothetical protein